MNQLDQDTQRKVLDAFQKLFQDVVWEDKSFTFQHLGDVLGMTAYTHMAFGEVRKAFTPPRTVIGWLYEVPGLDIWALITEYKPMALPDEEVAIYNIRKAFTVSDGGGPIKPQVRRNR